MAHEELALRSAAEIGAWSVVVAGAALLALALAAEITRRVRSGSALVALADRLLPTSSRRVAAGVVTVVAAALALAVPSGARADDHTRSWLVGDTTTSTSAPVDETAPVPSTTTTTSSAATTTSTTTTTTVVTHAPAAAPPAASAPVEAPRPAPVLRATMTPQSAAAPSPVRPVGPVTAPAPVAAAGTYSVAAGDCLWSIASRVLGRHATASAVDRGWRAIYAANRDAIGADPNLIHPGLVLTLPPLDPTD